tara:strand:+ start:1096 stop:2232 length:1137 start_codon:yes stop_codon:yes gene_type:complete
MAYNVLKGTVDGAVAQHTDQEIGGVKVFKNTLSASAFYDTDAQSPCATLKDVAVREIRGGGPGCVLISQGDTTLRAETLLTFDGEELVTRDIRARKFTGSGEGLTNIPNNKFTKPIKANHIDHAHGLHNIRGSLQIKTSQGLVANESGLHIALDSSCGLSIVNKALTVDPLIAKNISTDGQNLSDTDVMLVSDVSRRGTYNTTLQNLYENYIKGKAPAPAGAPYEIQIKDHNGFTATPSLSYDTKNNLLKVEGKTKTTHLSVEESVAMGGAVTKNIKMISDSEYEIGDRDYTILCDTNGHKKDKTIITLPPACNNVGRILVIKKASANKYSIKSGLVIVKSLEANIDINSEMTIKMNYSSRTLQSDGANWWVIASKGT